MTDIKALLASWARSFLAASLAIYMTDPSSPDIKNIAFGGVAAIAPVILRWLNPNDASFGVQGK
tara:strand:- start:2600 stop:2791 length:192 start_codon:yes stop_codon:yes gene_type:complete